VERRSGLGKGLAALIPAEAVTNEAGTTTLQDLPVVAIEPNPNQPRVHFDEESLADLAASIREMGVLQPVLVRAAEPGRYRLIAGERRWRAARRAGLDTIPAIVRDTDELGSIEQALVENLHRQDLTALEEAAAYQQLIEDFDLTHEDVATRVGKSRVAVTNTLRLLQLPPTIQHLLADGRLTAGHARALLGTPDRGFQETLARRAVAEHLSVRAVEEAVRSHAADAGRTEATGGPSGPTSITPIARQPLRPPGLLELEELLSDYLDTRVSVTMGTGRGKLVVEFATLEDLERIYRLVTEAPERH
jgi:ParB family transcriptional regulator, chromosome partitioning protein